MHEEKCQDHSKLDSNLSNPGKSSHEKKQETPKTIVNFNFTNMYTIGAISTGQGDAHGTTTGDANNTGLGDVVQIGKATSTSGASAGGPNAMQLQSNTHVPGMSGQRNAEHLRQEPTSHSHDQYNSHFLSVIQQMQLQHQQQQFKLITQQLQASQGGRTMKKRTMSASNAMNALQGEPGPSQRSCRSNEISFINDVKEDLKGILQDHQRLTEKIENLFKKIYSRSSD